MFVSKNKINGKQIELSIIPAVVPKIDKYLKMWFVIVVYHFSKPFWSAKNETLLPLS